MRELIFFTSCFLVIPIVYFLFNNKICLRILRKGDYWYIARGVFFAREFFDRENKNRWWPIECERIKYDNFSECKRDYEMLKARRDKFRRVKV